MIQEAPDKWQQIAVRFRLANGIRAGVEREVFGSCVGEINVLVEIVNRGVWLCCG